VHRDRKVSNPITISQTINITNFYLIKLHIIQQVQTEDINMTVSFT